MSKKEKVPTNKPKVSRKVITKDEVKPELIEGEVEGVVAKVEMRQLVLKSKMWTVVMKIETVLPESYRRYHMHLDLDERKWDNRIEDLEKELDDGLFREERTSRKSLNETIGKINDERNRMRRECKPIDFNCVVEQVKYESNGTVLTAVIPDDIIEQLNQQKYRMEAYKVTLKPLAF